MIDNILLVNAAQGREDVLRVVPEMFYFKLGDRTVFFEEGWEMIISHPEAKIDEAQGMEEKAAVGQAYYIPTRVLFE